MQVDARVLWGCSDAFTKTARTHGKPSKMERSEALRFEGHVSLIATGRRQPGWLAADQLLLKSFPIIIVHLFKESSFFISCSSLDRKRSEQISWIS
jgi:hypothetical protein